MGQSLLYWRHCNAIERTDQAHAYRGPAYSRSIRRFAVFQYGVSYVLISYVRANLGFLVLHYHRKRKDKFLHLSKVQRKMIDKELYALTCQIPEVIDQLQRLTDLKRDLASTRRRLSTLKNRYSFLKDIVSNINGTPLELAFVKFFNSIGYGSDKVIWTGSDNQKEDIQIWGESSVLCIEIKGLEKPNVKKYHVHQIPDFMALRRSEYPGKEIFGLVIANHDTLKPINERHPKPFDGKSETARLRGYGLVSAVQLLEAFIWVKKEQISFESFKEKLHQIGLVEFNKESERKPRPNREIC